MHDVTHEVTARPKIAVEPRHGGALGNRLAVFAGASCIALSGVLTSFAGQTPATVVFFRCSLALPILIPLAYFEIRRRGVVNGRDLVLSAFGGVLIGIDFACSVRALELVGVGVSTVLGNVQILVVPVLSWLVFRATVPRRFFLTLPAFTVGIVLLGGGFDSEADYVGVLLGLCSGTAYAIYVLIMRRPSADSGPATLAAAVTVTAGIAGAILGSIWGKIDLTPDAAALAWLALLAFGSQVLGWMLITHGLPGVRPEVAATLLLIMPVGALLAGIVLLGERPEGIQLVGCGLILAAIWFVSIPVRNEPDRPGRQRSGISRGSGLIRGPR